MVIEMFEKRKEIKHGKREDRENRGLGSFNRLFNASRHGCETSDRDPPALIFNETHLHRREQLDLELSRDKALILTRNHMVW